MDRKNERILPSSSHLTFPPVNRALGPFGPVFALEGRTRRPGPCRKVFEVGLEELCAGECGARLPPRGRKLVVPRALDTNKNETLQGIRRRIAAVSGESA